MPKQRYHENCSATKSGNSTIPVVIWRPRPPCFQYQCNDTMLQCFTKFPCANVHWMYTVYFSVHPRVLTIWPNVTIFESWFDQNLTGFPLLIHVIMDMSQVWWFSASVLAVPKKIWACEVCVVCEFRRAYPPSKYDAAILFTFSRPVSPVRFCLINSTYPFRYPSTLYQMTTWVLTVV
jgi:hypothetical protein